MACVRVSDTSFDGLKEMTAEQALNSFDFFCNHVLGLCIDPAVCDAVQSALDASTHARVLTRMPKTVSGALTLWLRLQGYVVAGVEASDVRLGEVYDWVFSGWEPDERPEAFVVKAKGDAVLLLCSVTERIAA